MMLYNQRHHVFIFTLFLHPYPLSGYTGDGVMMHKNGLKKLICLNLLLFCGIALFIPQSAIAQNCTITNPATAIQTSVGEYGAQRDGGARSHRGVDIMIPMCTPVPNQTVGGQPCTIMMNGTSPVWKTGGYGLYARYNCGPRVEVRYAHLNGWTAGLPSNGRSGAAKQTPPHIHYEVIIYPNGSSRGGIKVDPQCVWGAHPNRANCCSGLGANCGLGVSPANMCDNTVLDALVRNANNRGFGRGKTTGMSIASGISPQSVGPGPFEKDEPQCSDTPPDDPNTPEREDQQPQQGVEHEHNDITDLEAGGQLPVLQPPPFNPTTPSIDPAPDELPPVPGTPGGDPTLVPTAPTSEDSEISGCAMDTWVAMVNQAAIETRREDIVNKRFIVKSDSVLRFGCFEQHIKTAADSLGSVFSETQKWRSRTVDLIGKRVEVRRELGTQSLDNALASVVENTTQSYYNRQFNHAPLSGSTPVGATSGGTNCNLMNRVWQAAKCKNFDDVNVFYSFDDLKTTDPREFPANMRCDG